MNRKTNILLMTLLFSPFFLTSCFVLKKYERTVEPAENLFRTDHIQDSLFRINADDTSLGAISWREVFTDSTLQRHIEHALSQNFDILIAIQSIDAAAAYLKQGKAAFGPAVNGSLNYSLTHNPGNIHSGNFSQYQLGVDLSWEADIWGKIRSRKNVAAAAYLQSIEAHHAVKTRLVANLATLYYQLIALDEQVEIARLSIQTRKSSLQTTVALMEGGDLTAVAIQQTQAQVYDAQNILLGLENQRRVLENAFCLLLSEPSHAIRRGKMDEQSVQTPLTLGVPAHLLANRPDVRHAELDLIQALELTNVAKASFYPSLVINAAGGFRDTDMKKWLTPDGIFGQIAGGLLQPILSRRQIKTTYEVAQTVEEQALLRYQQALLLAGNEVSDALNDYQTYTDAIVLQKLQHEALDTAVIYSQQLLMNGLANYLEVLTAQQNLLTTELNLTDTRFKRLAAVIRLYQALGGGWR